MVVGESSRPAAAALAAGSAGSVERRAITVALAGQPNVGKSTVFNMLTGLNQHVGNWPGKTVERKTGEINRDGRVIRVVDLPGTYGLTANSEEERIARDFILQERPDAVVAIVNAAALERSLYLVAELMLLPMPLVVGLNMTDVAEQRGIRVEPQVLASALGVPVVPLVASRNRGVRELMQVVEHVVDGWSPPACGQECRLCPGMVPNRPTIRSEHVPVLAEVSKVLAGRIPPPYPEDWVALKLLEGDAEVAEMVRRAAPEAWAQVHEWLRRHEDAYLDIVGARYEWIGRMVRAAVVRPRAGVIALTDSLDRLATHPVWGMLILLAVLGVTFWLTSAVSAPLVHHLEAGLLGPMLEGLRQALAGAPQWFSGLVVDGLGGGAGTVVTFVPIMVVFFAVLGLLEDVGYLARAAYVMDRLMHRMGLHGKSFMPLFLGFGCNVPAVLGARIVEGRRGRLLTVLLVPFVPCTARMAVVAFLAPAFFGRAAPLAAWGLVAGNLVALALVGVVTHRVVFRGESGAFIMEMPLYHWPNLRTIGLSVWHNTLSFLRKASTTIVAFSALVWLLSAIPGGDVGGSVLAYAGRALSPVGQWMGLGDWRLIVALLTSFAAKENTIATLGILFGTGQGVGLAERMAQVLTPAAALAFLAVQLLFIPCAATVAVMRQEMGSWRWVAAGLGLMLIVSLLAGTIVYQVGRLF